METVARSSAAARTSQTIRLDLPGLGTWLLAFALVAYLALEHGGYDVVVRSEVGIAVWWIVLLGVVAGLLPVARVSPAGWIGLGLLVAFAGWTALGIGWSESAERGATELARVATYAGVLALALCVQGRDGARHIVNGLASAVALVGGLAVLSRLQPAWFGPNEVAVFFPGTERRLNYPLAYSNGLGAFMALGLPVILSRASGARRLAGQALAAAAVPLMVLCAYLTVSRGAPFALAAGVLVFLALAPDRLPKLATLLVSGGGGAILVAAVHQRPALEDALTTAAAQRQGEGMLAMAVVVCAGVALMQVGIGLAARHGRRPRWMSVAPRPAAGLTAAGVLVAVVIAVAAGLPGEVRDRWEEFKAPAPAPTISQRDTFTRLASFSGARYQYWQSALDANATDPIRGIGPGSFEFWWARNGTGGEFIRDAHSLYLETLAELGIVGLVLLAALLGLILATGALRAARAPRRERLLLAAATAGCTAFCVSAAGDWAWELSVLPISFFLLAAVVLARRARPEPDGLRGPAPVRRWAPLGGRVALVLASAGALVAIALPLAGASAVRESQADIAQKRLTAALEEARTAERVQPYAATPKLQSALVLERAGALEAAASAARVATADEPTNWRTWLVRSRIEARRGQGPAAVSAYRRARSLHPRSALFAR